MPDLIELEVATPERLMVREKVSEVQVPGQDGYLGILPGHAPLLGLLGTGLLSYRVGPNRRYLAVQGGFLEVQPEHLRVLANVAERAEEIDVQRAKDDLKKAEADAVNPSIGIDPAAAWAVILHQQARVEAAEKNSTPG
ncbi:ATP synthase epsilon chain [Candidatus Sulfopaludibacter sp. SbA6]|nr:ATP synthase epsilon chain [Candidatus Sulfopaludibacter sp. SbA6]